jgi:hypothetical protein
MQTFIMSSPDHELSFLDHFFNLSLNYSIFTFKSAIKNLLSHHQSSHPSNDIIKYYASPSTNFHHYPTVTDHQQYRFQDRHSYNYINNNNHHHYPLSHHAFMLNQDFDPDFIATIVTRELNDNLKRIIFAISPDKTNFIAYQSLQNNTMIQTAGGPTQILGQETIEWTLINQDGSLIPIQIPCQHVPAAKMRLLSPQALCQFLNLDCSKDRLEEILATFGCKVHTNWSKGFSVL